MSLLSHSLGWPSDDWRPVINRPHRREVNFLKRGLISRNHPVGFVNEIDLSLMGIEAGTIPKVSIITTTYNRKKFLKRAIDSVLAQSFKDWEVIVVDDCSTDGTEELRNLNHPQIKYIKTKKNWGTDNRPKNIGIRAARGEYIVFLDDDDVYKNDGLKILYKYIKESGADVVYGDYIIHDINGKKGVGWSFDFDSSLLQKMNYIAMSVVIARKKCLEDVGGFDESVPKFKDWNLWLRLHKRGYSFLHVPIIVSEVFALADSISSKFKEEKDGSGAYKPTWFNPADMTIYASKTILGKKKDLKVAVFTLTMNRLEYTKTMRESLSLAGYSFDWFVVDQGSNDGTIEWIAGKTKAAIFNKKNKGIARGWNQAIELIKKTGQYDIVIKIDNDAQMMSRDWLKKMVEIFERSRKVVMSPYVEGLEDAPGGVLRKRESGQQQPYVLINDNLLGIAPFLGGIVWAAPIELYEEWKFPETFFAGNKDYMISQFAKQSGYSLFYLEELRVWHIRGTKGQREDYPDYFKTTEWAARHKIAPDAQKQA